MASGPKALFLLVAAAPGEHFLWKLNRLAKKTIKGEKYDTY
jgi:hypothetical protein